VALFVLILAAPLMMVIAIAIRITSPGPALFRQKRSGLGGRPFQLLKFRTMRSDPFCCSVKLTSKGDKRVTSIGKWLRAWKLDELPQFINVLKGDMSLVGPRPDIEEFWLQLSESDRTVLAMKPGITGAASLIFIREEELLAQVPQAQLIEYYVSEILPRKVDLDLDYAARASLWSDIDILLRTVLRVFHPPCAPITNSAV
jgi:lipopolysaccharide/colanic/teichoic acid biosynthesis glycosyltransferase